MIYPEFKELLKLEASSKLLGSKVNSKGFSEMSGNYRSAFRGQGMEFEDIRQYHYGDDVRHIDWRVSARLDGVHVKQFREEKQRNVLILLDMNDYMKFGTRNTFKNVLAAKIASMFSFLAFANQDKVGFYLFGNLEKRFQYFAPNASRKNILSALKVISTPNEHNEEFSLDGALFNLKRMNVNADIIFVISDFMDYSEIFEKNIYNFASSAQLVFTKVCDDSDFEIPDIGKLVLSDEDSRFLLNTSSARGLKTYRNQYNNNLAAVKKLAKKSKGKFFLVNTKDDILKTIKKQFV